MREGRRAGREGGRWRDGGRGGQGEREVRKREGHASTHARTHARTHTHTQCTHGGGAGTVGARTVVAGGDSESVAQPAWSPAGRLHFVSDRRGGWYNLHQLDGAGAVR